MKWTNYHTHSHYCDGKNSIEDHIQSAIKHNIFSLGMSSHCPVPFENGWSMKLVDLNTYLEEIDQLKLKYKGSIDLYKSLEVDYIPGIIGPSHPTISDADLDYVIGSLHFVDAFEDGQPCVIDGPHNAFLRGLESIHKGDIKVAVKRFFSITRQMVREDCPDIVGHFDKIRMQNKNGLWDETSEWYRQEILNTLEEIQSSNAIVEVNTRGIYKKNTPEPYPSLWALDQIKRMGVPICMNSDGHQPKEIIGVFEATSKMLHQKGFREVSIFANGQWVARSLTEDGIQTRA